MEMELAGDRSSTACFGRLVGEDSAAASFYRVDKRQYKFRKRKKFLVC